MNHEPHDPADLRELYGMPGHLIRRAKQKTTATFAPIVRRFNLTPIQYAVLKATSVCPGVDQAQLGDLVGLDTSTTGGVVARLEQRGLVARTAEGRRQLVTASPAALALLDELAPILAATQKLVMHPLTSKEQEQLLRLLSKMVGISNRHYEPRVRGRRRAAPEAADG